MLNFYRGSRSAYPESIQKGHELWDAIYFATTDNESHKCSSIIINGETFGINSDIVDIEGFDTGFKILRADGTEQEIEFGLDVETQRAIDTLKSLLNEEGELDFSLLYKSAMPDDQTVGTDIGGIKGSVTAGELKTKNISEVLDMLIFPTVQPAHTTPSVTIALGTGFSSQMYVGDTCPTSVSNFKITHNKGTVTLLGKTLGDYAGDATMVSLVLNGAALTDDQVFKTPGAKKYTYTAAFAKGNNYNDNKGNPCSSDTGIPFSGRDFSGNITIQVSYPWYATTSTSTEYTKLEFIAWNTVAMTTGNITFADKDTSNDPNSMMAFKIPREATKIEFRNPLNATDWAVQPMDNWDITTVEETLGTEKHTYYEYKLKEAVRGGAIARITF